VRPMAPKGVDGAGGVARRRAFFGVIAGFFAVLFTGEYPQRIRDFLVNVYRYALRVEAYVGFLTDSYPPFSLAA
jgi:hypothetical protein